MKIGVLTFHRVYNYGAVIQAYCTQKILDELNIDNEIIDFSIKKQKDYTDLYSKRNGLKRFAKTLLLIPFHKERVSRKKKFDSFINSMKLSSKSYNKSEYLRETNKNYDCYLVGSDQVWNITKKAESSDAYFLDFADEDKRKISYASSIGVATYEDLVLKEKYLKQFDAISCRESGGAQILSDIVDYKVQTVLDPTLLVDKNILVKEIYKIENDPYILYYSLDGFDKRKNNLDILKALSEKFGYKVKFITPEWPYHEFGEDLRDVGPIEFLNLIQQAKIVCTNSFHGTALSIKLGVPFYVLESKNIKDERKRSILKQLELQDRIISSYKDIGNIDDYSINYNKVNTKLKELMKLSSIYLKKALDIVVEE